MQCPVCQSENPDDARFCEDCGVKLEVLCPACSAPTTPGKSFCRNCGEKLGQAQRRARVDASQPNSDLATPKHLAERILSSRNAMEGERKQVTVLFADIKSSTELVADLDPEQASKRLDPAIKMMRDAVHGHDGTVNKVQGDGIMALFGAPLALEDHAVRAAYAALNMRDEIKRAAGLGLEVRVGLHSGEVVVRSIRNDLSLDYDAVGATVHLAARMEQLAQPGSIVMTSETYRLVEGFVETRPLGPTEVRGLSEPIHLFELISRTTALGRWDVLSARGLTRLAGREAELSSLNRSLERAALGEGQLAALVGEAGMGKSRLAHEFVRLAAARGWAVRTTAAAPHRNSTAYFPVSGLLRSLFEVEEADSQADIAAKVRANIVALDENLQPIIPALHSVLDLPIEDAEWQELDPMARRNRILSAIKALALRRAQSVPLLLVFEDLHWIDTETQAVLDSLADVLGAARLMLLVTYRPEYKHDWSGKTHYTRIRVDPLTDETSGQLLHSLLGSDPSLDQLKRLLVERTAGRPLFQEETVRELVETGVITGQAGHYRLTGDVGTVDVPRSVQAVLAARIDRLPPTQKNVLHVASVVGRTVQVPILRAAMETSESELLQILSQLQAAEFLFETRMLPNPEYTFKHALTHDVAYRSILLERRKSLHGKLVEIIEERHQARLDEHVEQLADNAVRGELWDKAAVYCRQAAFKALRRSAHDEAIAFLNKLVLVLGQLPQSADNMQLAIDAHLDLRAAYGATGDVRKMSDHLQTARELAESIDDRVRSAWITIYSTSVVELRGHLDAAIPKIEQARKVAREEGDENLLRMTSFVLCAGNLSRADHERALDALAPHRADYKGSLRHERFGMTGTWSVQCMAMSTMAHLKLGQFPDAIRCAEDCRSVAEEVDRPFDLGIADWALGSSLFFSGNLKDSVAVLERGIDLCRASGTNILVPMLVAPLAYAYALNGAHNRAEKLSVDAWTQLRGTNVFWLYIWLYAPLGMGMLEVGNLSGAREVGTYALNLARKMGMRGMETDSLRVLGGTYGGSEGADVEEAKKHLVSAMAMAEELRMPAEKANCQFDLAKIQAQAGSVNKARQNIEAAIKLYRDLDMPFWLNRAETMLAKVAAGRPTA
jgi:class 3 adenylate cyclase/tetratricopeptide (TPR) repeat protein